MSNFDYHLGNNWCPYQKYNPTVPQNQQGHYTTVEEGKVIAAFRNSGPDNAMPPVPRHGGLFSGEETKNPWNAIPVTPTMTNYIQNNLRSANPPPGATEQYVGGERLGNNYAPMPGTYWYNPTDHMNGKFRMKVTKSCNNRQFDATGMPTMNTTFYSELLNN